MVWRAKQDVAGPVAEPVAVSPTPTADLTPAPPEPASPPPIAVPAAEPLPALADSDDDVLAAIATLTGSDTTRVWLYPEHVIERIVATVDALPRQKLAPRVRSEERRVGKECVKTWRSRG